MNPSYWAILPANVRYDENLKCRDKLLYCELTVLTHKEGFAWATNNYFAGLYQVSIRTIQRSLLRLQKAGYIYIEVLPIEGNTRKIYMADAPEMSRGRSNVSRGDVTRVMTPHDKPDRDTLYNNSTRLNKKNEGETRAQKNETDDPFGPPSGRSCPACKPKRRSAPDPVDTFFEKEKKVAPKKENAPQPHTGHLAANPPSPDEIAMAMTPHLHDPDKAGDLAEQFFNNYQAQGWIRGNGVPISRWKYLAYDWCRRENEKKKTKQHDKRPKQHDLETEPLGVTDEVRAKALALLDARLAAKAEHDPRYAAYFSA